MQKTPKVIDLTQPLGPATALWPGSVPFVATEGANHDTHGYYFRNLEMPEHSGTHFDAPIHFGDGQRFVHELEGHELVVPAVRLDFRAESTADRDFTISAAHIERFEAQEGEITEGTAVLICTGWDAYIDDHDMYLGDPMSFPGLGGDAAKLLVERGVVGIGIDTLSVDAGYTTEFPVHYTTQPAGLWHLEGLVNLDKVPARGAHLVIGVVKLIEGSGAPARVFALLPD